MTSAIVYNNLVILRWYIWPTRCYKFTIFYCYKCSTYFGLSLPIIRSSELYMQPCGVWVVRCPLRSFILQSWCYGGGRVPVCSGVRLRAPDDGQWWPEICRAFITIKYCEFVASCWSYIPPWYLTMHGPMNIKTSYITYEFQQYLRLLS
jgi:hypothetical protein